MNKENNNMLSEISFNELCEEVKLIEFKNKENVILGLLNAYGGLSKKQIQQIIFLTMVEEHIILPFTFKHKSL